MRRSWPSPDTLTTWRSLLVLQRHLVEVLDAELRAESGIPLEHYDVLYQLSLAIDHRLRMSELARRLLIVRSTCTRLVDRLVRQELLERRHDPTDRRLVWVALTPQGHSVQSRAARAHLNGIEAHFGAKLTPAELACLAQVLNKLADD
ncbi:MAG: MarR family winged helix-turn-helix transcriptional regulator [Pseudonocardiaceae bacterium]